MDSSMDSSTHLIALAREGAALLETAMAADPALPVPSCPGWNIADLVWHVADAHHFWRTIVGERLDSRDGYRPATRPAADGLFDFYRATLDETLTVLSSVDPTQPTWTWSSDNSAHFAIRRLAHETAMHRWDARSATAGEVAALDPHLASDGIDEFVNHFLQQSSADANSVGGSVHLHCTDVPGEWTVRPAVGKTFLVAAEHAKGDAAMRGPASALLLVLWRRRDLTTIDVVGDAEVAARYVAHSNYL